MAIGTRLQVAIDQIRFARDYTNQLFADVRDDEWFVVPEGSVSHLAWQMGHLAMAQYGLTMIRLRGKEPEDAEFITTKFMRAFKKGSTPQPDPTVYPPIDEIRRTFDLVFEHAVKGLQGVSDEELTETIPEPYAVENTKLGSLFFCSHHEMLHAGQIGILRRMLGKEPLR